MFIRKEVPPKLEILCKKRHVLIFLLILIGIPAIFILSVKNGVGWGDGGVLLNGQNLLKLVSAIFHQIFIFFIK